MGDKVKKRKKILIVSEVEPEPGELEAIAEADEDIRLNGTVPHEAIQW